MTYEIKSIVGGILSQTEREKGRCMRRHSGTLLLWFWCDAFKYGWRLRWYPRKRMPL